MSSYASILSFIFSKVQTNWFTINLESANSYTFVASILNTGLRAKIAALYSALLFKTGIPNLIIFFYYLSLRWNYYIVDS